MKREVHITRAKAFERTIEKEFDERETQYATIIEAAFMASFQYINAFLAEKDVHSDNHRGLARFLKDEAERREVAEEFLKLQTLRIGDVYGGKINGDASEKAVESRKKIKTMLGFGGEEYELSI